MMNLYQQQQLQQQDGGGGMAGSGLSSMMTLGMGGAATTGGLFGAGSNNADGTYNDDALQQQTAYSQINTRDTAGSKVYDKAEQPLNLQEEFTNERLEAANWEARIPDVKRKNNDHGG